MLRREFLKLAAIVPFSGIVMGKRCPKPSEKDETMAKLWEVSDYATGEGPFVLHEGVWFFSDMEMVKWCPKYNLCWNGWDSCPIGRENYDYFDFWKKTEGKLYWFGKYTCWEVRTHPVMGAEFIFIGNI